jgi:hypothetical protein
MSVIVVRVRIWWQPAILAGYVVVLATGGALVTTRQAIGATTG